MTVFVEQLLALPGYALETNKNIIRQSLLNMVHFGWPWFIFIVSKVSCGVREVLERCHMMSEGVRKAWVCVRKVLVRWYMVSGMSQEDVRWCEEGSYSVTNVSGRYQMVSGMCQTVSRKCQVILGRWQGGVRLCQEGVKKVSVCDRNVSDVGRKVFLGCQDCVRKVRPFF